MIGLFSILEVIEPQGNYMEELYDSGEYKLAWMLCCYFSCIANLFYIYQTCIFCNFHEIYFETTENSLLWKRVLINKIIMRLVKDKHIKYRQDNWHHMTWYTDICSIMAMGLLYGLTLWSNVCAWDLHPMVSWPRRSHSQWMVIIGRTSLEVWATRGRTRSCR
jgi:hypothetical protein